MSLSNVKDFVKQQFKSQKITYVRIYSEKRKNKMLEHIKFYKTNINQEDIEKIIKQLNNDIPDKNYYITYKIYEADYSYYREKHISIFITKATTIL